jgi:tetratricopeptide (TPR) repeat protein
LGEPSQARVNDTDVTPANEDRTEMPAKALERADKISPNDPRLLYLKSVLAPKRKRPAEALALLISIIEKQSAEPHVYLAAADIYQNELKDLPQALKYPKQFTQLMESEEIEERIRKLEGAISQPDEERDAAEEQESK